MEVALRRMSEEFAFRCCAWRLARAWGGDEREIVEHLCRVYWGCLRHLGAGPTPGLRPLVLWAHLPRRQARFRLVRDFQGLTIGATHSLSLSGQWGTVWCLAGSFKRALGDTVGDTVVFGWQF